MRGERKKKGKLRNFIKGIFMLIIFFAITYISVGIYKESKIKLKEKSENKIQVEEAKDTLEEVREKVNIPNTYLDYEVTAKLVIPKIELETYILKDYTKERMDVCPTKFWGPEPNEIGNFCITGHNYKKDNMFYNLIDLEIGDEFYLLDNKNGKYTYTIYDIYKVKPQNTDSLEQDTGDKRIVTLITCVNYSDTRLIIQAVEKGI